MVRFTGRCLHSLLLSTMCLFNPFFKLWEAEDENIDLWHTHTHTHTLIVFLIAVCVCVNSVLSRSRNASLHLKINQTGIYDTVALLSSQQSLPGVEHSSWRVSGHAHTHTHTHTHTEQRVVIARECKTKTKKRNSGNKSENKPTKQ